MIQRIALAQMCSGIDPAANAMRLQADIAAAARQGADIIFTPEMTGLLDRKRSRAQQHICPEKDDPVLQAARDAAAESGLWVALGSLALKSDQTDHEKAVNRSFVIAPNGDIVARYDKIHLFDVALASGESWKESSAYDPGTQAVVADVGSVKLGLSICYDLRFASLYTALTNAGASLLAVPAAFTVPTGQAHWEVLLRARAIEAGAFVVAAAQCGVHEDGRETYGHSLVVDPWGEVLLDMGTGTGVATCAIDWARLNDVRGQVPAIDNRRDFQLPGDTG